MRSRRTECLPKVSNVDTVGSLKKQGTQRVGFLLMDQFTLVSLSSAIDPLRVANSLSDTELYSWCLIGAGEEEQVSSDGVRVKLDHTLTDEIELDLVIVVGGIDIEQSVTKVDLSWLRKQAQRGAQMGALCTGSYALASAGLLYTFGERVRGRDTTFSHRQQSACAIRAHFGPAQAARRGPARCRVGSHAQGPVARGAAAELR